MCELGMSSTGAFKASWKDLVLEKMFIDLYVEEVNTLGKRGNSLNAKFWEVIVVKIKDIIAVFFSQKQLENHRDYFKIYIT